VSSALKDDKRLKSIRIDTIKKTWIVSIDFHRLMKPININQLTFIDYTDYIDWFPTIDFHRLGTPGIESLVHPQRRNLKLRNMIFAISFLMAGLT